MMTQNNLHKPRRRKEIDNKLILKCKTKCWWGIDDDGDDEEDDGDDDDDDDDDDEAKGRWGVDGDAKSCELGVKILLASSREFKPLAQTIVQTNKLYYKFINQWEKTSPFGTTMHSQLQLQVNW